MFRSDYKAIGVDIDGTFCDHERKLEEKVNKAFGTSFSEENPLYTKEGVNLPSVPQWGICTEAKVEEVIKACKIRGFIEEQYENEFLNEVLNAVHPKRFKALQQLAVVRPVFILTARSPVIFKETVDIFRKKASAIEGVVMTSSSKSYWCYGLGMSVLFEDNVNTIEEVLKNSETKVVMIKKHYNESLEATDRLIPVESFEEGVEEIYRLWKKGEV